MKTRINPHRYRRGSGGFRVVALVALLGAGGGGWWYLNDLKKPTPEELKALESIKRADVVDDIVSIRSALRAFKDETGAYPTTEEGLAALVKSGDLKEEQLKDRFGNPYSYTGPSDPDAAGGESEFKLFSVGKDGKAVTADDISFSEVTSPPGG